MRAGSTMNNADYYCIYMNLFSIVSARVSVRYIYYMKNDFVVCVYT